MTDGNKTDPAQQLRRALLAIEKAEARAARLEAASREPIAVVGLGCRFPRAATSSEFWQNLVGGVDCIREVPADRWDVDALYDPDPDAAGKMITRWGGFIDGADQFDPMFFGVSPREASRMDPQQRLALEVAWEALEDAALVPAELAGRAVGVFMGACANDYGLRFSTNLASVDAHSVTGAALSIIANRISYLLNFKGPSVVVDTACSSSLVAIHLACQSLRAGECEVALAGGVNTILVPHETVFFSRARALAPDGRCKTFDARADGFVRGEGCGVVVLKRASDARAAGDRILAVVRGSAVNQDGTTSGMTAPSGLSQQAVIRRALDHAGVAAGRVAYVEAHGTGTALGDPIEVEALAKVLGAPSDVPTCWLGAVKTNIGHLEGGAGAAGFIKAVLALHHGVIPPNLHFQKLNAGIPVAGTRIGFPTQPVAWPSGEQARFAGVSSFGFGGTNAHLVLEDARPARPARPVATPAPVLLLPLSARSEPALAEAARRLSAHLAAHPEQTLADVCYTAALGRSQFRHRVAIRADTPDALRQALDAFASGAPSERASVGPALTSQRPRVAFLFTGQGSQYANMGRGLYGWSAVFRGAIDECAELLRPHLDVPLQAILFPAPARDGLIDETAYTQPALFALEYALVRLWRSWGVAPDVVMGHGIGELVAACVAGVFGLGDALALVAARGRIEVSHAFHSPLDESALDAFEARAAQVALAAPSVPIISSVTGARAGAELATAGYWRRHLRAPVLFRQGLEAVRAHGATVLVEIGPSATLLPLAAEALGADAGALVPSLRRQKEDREQLLEALAHLWTHGVAVDWAAIHRASPGRRVSLPTAAFERRRYWYEKDPAPQQWRRAVREAPAHPLLGRRLPVAGRDDVVFDATLDVGELAALGDHRLAGQVIVPAACLVEMARAAAAHVLGEAELAGVVLLEPLALPDAGGVRVQTVVAAEVSGQASFEIFSLPPGGEAGPWRRHASGGLQRASAADRLPPIDRVEVEARCTERRAASGYYEDLSARGLAYGPAFRGVAELRRGEQEAVARISPQAGSLELAACGMSPALLDLGLQVLASLADGGDDLYLPAAAERIVIRPGAYPALWAHARLRERPAPGAPTLVGDVILADERGGAVARLDGLCLRRVAATALRRDDAGAIHPWFYRIAWTPCPPVAEASLPSSAARSADGPGTWLIIGGDAGLDSALGRALEAAGERTVRARHGGHLAQVAQVAQVGPGEFALDAEQPDHVQRLFDAVGPLRGVVYVGALDGADDRGSILERGRRVAVSALHVAQAAARCAPRPALWLVTRGAQPVGSELVEAVQAPLWGLGRTIQNEHPELACHLVDLDPALAPAVAPVLASALAAGSDGDAREVAALAGELLRAGAENQLALRGGARLAARLVRETSAPRTSPAVPRGERSPGDAAVSLGEATAEATTAATAEATAAVTHAATAAATVKAMTAATAAATTEVTAAAMTETTTAATAEATARTAGRRAGATWLVTGGLGGLGLAVARWLVVDQGVRGLVLLGRSAPNAAAREAIAALERAGARVVVARGDVARRADVARALTLAGAGGGADLPPLVGIVHAAGVLDDAVLAQQSAERFARVMAPKLAGAAHLDELTRDLPIEAFVMFSSAASLLGSPGQANYAAANAFLDALAHRRHAEGLPAIAIAWGPWAEVGLAAAANRGSRLGARGLDAIVPADGLAALGRILRDARAPAVAVLRARWGDVLGRFLPGREPPVLAELAREVHARGEAGAGMIALARRSALLAELQEAAPGRRRTLLVELVRDEVGKVLGFGAAQAIDAGQGLTELGFDSLMAVELATRLQDGLGRPFPPTLIFDHPTIEGLGELLAREVFGEESAAAPVPVPPAVAPASSPRAQSPALQDAALGQLSEGEMAALLAETLREIEGMP
jgi:polyketide synthase 12/myxalamid-type polyketide synthase MxaB